MSTSQGATPDHQLLEPFVGTWQTEGVVLEADLSGQSVRFQARDTYEWLPGGFFLLHRFEADMPIGHIAGIEVIGHDPARKNFPMHSFDSKGNAGTMHARHEGSQWIFEGEGVRFSGTFSDDGSSFAGRWEARSGEGAGWKPWMDMKMRKTV